NGFQLASVPEEQGSVWFSYRPATGFTTGGGMRYVGESYGGGDVIETPSYTLVDLMLGYRTDHWQYSFNVRNATDKEYQATCLSRGDCFPGKERTFFGRVKYTF